MELTLQKRKVRISTERSQIIRRAVGLFGLLVILSLPALLNLDVVLSTASLHHLAKSPHPYFLPAYAWVLYLKTPLVVVSACVLLLSPGLLLAITLNAAKDNTIWLACGFALSLIFISAAVAVAQAITGDPWIGSRFVILVIICALASFLSLICRAVRGNVIWPRGVEGAKNYLPLFLISFLLLTVLVPKFYWENFNGDGAHAFETSRFLLFHPLPFWPKTAGEISSFPGLTSFLFAYPASWFVRLFGETEASVRIPYVLYLSILYVLLIGIIEHLRIRRLGMIEKFLIFLSLLTYTWVVVYSATYNPYVADIALPATQDTLLMVCFLSFVLFFLRREHRWMSLFLVLTYLSLPNATMLLALWLLATWLYWTPRSRRTIFIASMWLLGCVVFSVIAPALFRSLGLNEPGVEYSTLGLLKQMRHVQWSNVQRILFLVVPCGILPAFFLAAWRGQDFIARGFTLVTILYFGFFYFQFRTALHYYIPVMIFPLIVFWRHEMIATDRKAFLMITTAICGILAFILSSPKSYLPDTSGRLLGSAIEDRTAGYLTFDPKALRNSIILRHIVPPLWDKRVPAERYGGAARVWLYYAHHPSTSGQKINYVLQELNDPPPAGMQLLAKNSEVALYFKSESQLEAHRSMRPPTPAGSKIYAISKKTLLGL